jgi:CHRD domain
MRFGKRALLVGPVFVLALAAVTLPAIAFGDDGVQFRARATGFNEILQNPGGAAGTEAGAINTDGLATLRTTLRGSSIDFRFEFSGLTTNLLQAHYHFSQPHVSGGIMVFLCGPAGTPAKQACPAATSGVVSGTLTASDVIGPVPQNMAAGDLASVERAIRNGAAYLNLHTTMFPGGEIRGQLQHGNAE